MSLESGKPIKDALVEVDRATLTFRLGAEEAERMTGELIPLDLMPSSKGRIGITRRFPIGPIAAISPFNFPLNLAAHKLAPAIAAGNTIVLKPPSKDPLTMLTVAEIVEKSGVPEGAVSILPMTRELGDRMVEDERFKLLTFTGSPSVGWRMKERAGKKRVVLELGGNAGVIVDAIGRPRLGRQALAGGRLQLRRPGVHQRPAHVHPPRRLRRLHRALRRRRPSRSSSVTRSIPRRSSARWSTRHRPSGRRAGCARLRSSVAECCSVAVPTARSSRRQCWSTPRQRRRCARTRPLRRSSSRSRSTTSAMPSRQVNDCFYGLQTGVFTNDLQHSWQAFNELEVGGVIVNDVPTYRIDHMPYGGVKDSGLGREGLRWSIEDMTEVRLMVMAEPDPPAPAAGQLGPIGQGVTR